MSKSDTKTPITITDKDLSEIAKRISGDDRCAISHQALLNLFSAELLGGKADWGRIAKAEAPMASQRAAALAAAGEADRTIQLTDEESGTATPALLRLDGEGVKIRTKDASAWIEMNDGCFKVHVGDSVSEGLASIWSKPGRRLHVETRDYEDMIHPGSEDVAETESDSMEAYMAERAAEEGGPAA